MFWVHLAVVVIALAGPLMLHVAMARADLSDGTRISPGLGSWSASALPVTVGLASGHPVSVRMVAVDGRSLSDWVADSRSRGLRDGQSLTYTLRRAGGITTNLVVRLRHLSFDTIWSGLLPSLPLLVSLDVVAAVVFVRRPTYTPSRLVLLLAALVPLSLTDWPAGMSVADVPGPHAWFFVVNDLAAALSWAALLHFVLVFPSPGRWLRRHRWLNATGWVLPFLLYGARLVFVAVSSSDPLARREAVLAISAPASLAVPVVAIVLMARRYLTERGAARVPLRWLLGGLASSVGIYLALGALPYALGADAVVPGRWQPVLFALLPLCVGIAILRFNLFDIELIVRRSLLYLAISAVVLAVYVLTTVLLGHVFGSGAALVLASGVLTLTVLPLRDWLQRSTIRRVYGERSNPQRVITTLLGLDTSAAPEAVLGDIAATLAASLRLTYVAIDLRRDDGSVLAHAERGHTVRAPVEVPLLHGDRTLGRLLLDVGARQEPFGPADRMLLDAVAHQLAGAGYTVLLASALQRSRERLVQAREEERRRLRRDLHDGLGPRLATVAMQLEVARTQVVSDPATADRTLERLHHQSMSSITEIRRLVDDLRPPNLDELGLLSALQEQTQGATTATADGIRHVLPVVFDCPDELPALPAAVEVAAYRIVLEAVNNVSKHARASRCTVRLEVSQDLVLTVHDDGIGIGADPRTGVGLASMSERAAELGGSCTIGSTADVPGTTVTARLPITAWS